MEQALHGTGTGTLRTIMNTPTDPTALDAAVDRHLLATVATAAAEATPTQIMHAVAQVAREHLASGDVQAAQKRLEAQFHPVVTEAAKTFLTLVA